MSIPRQSVIGGEGTNTYVEIVTDGKHTTIPITDLSHEMLWRFISMVSQQMGELLNACPNTTTMRRIAAKLAEDDATSYERICNWLHVKADELDACTMHSSMETMKFAIELAGKSDSPLAAMLQEFMDDLNSDENGEANGDTAAS